jgi:hypothetical protein
MLYISNHLNQSITFRKFNNKNTNKNKKPKNKCLRFYKYFRSFEVTYSQKTNRKLKKNTNLGNNIFETMIPIMSIRALFEAIIKFTVY